MKNTNDLICEILNSNLSDKTKQEAIYIIKQYNQNNIQDALLNLIKTIGLGIDILELFKLD